MGETPRHQELLLEAIERQGDAFRLLLAGDAEGAEPGLTAAAARYRASWEAAPTRAFGRLVGHLTMSILAGDAGEAAAYVSHELGDGCDSPASCYALGLAVLVEGDDEEARRCAEGMRGDTTAFDHAAEAMVALCERDRSRYKGAVGAIVSDFESREQHLTGVALADTALVFERLAEERGMAARLSSPVLPPR